MAIPGVRATPATATPASIALTATRGAHPTLRLDNFLRNTDHSYQHAEGVTQGDRFVRKMATYGQVRPSVSFTSESRVTRPFDGAMSCLDMSNLPSQALDPKGDPRELSLEYPPPPREVNTDHMKLYENHSLMLPSERYKEHLLIKEATKKWKEDREAIFTYKKKLNVLERHYPQGVTGIDGPMYPGTKLYERRRDAFVGQEDRKSRHAEGRHAELTGQHFTDDGPACREYGAATSDHRRSRDICIQTKRVDPAQHPFRFLDTHDRLFPKFEPTWDPERAMVIRSHEIRDGRHNIISGSCNDLHYAPAKMERVSSQVGGDALSRTAPSVGGCLPGM